MRLDKECILLRVQATGDVCRHLSQRPAAKVRRDLPDSDGVHVRQHVVAVIFVRQGRPVLNGPQIRPQRQIAGGLNTAENPLFPNFIFHDWNTSNLSIESALRKGCNLTYRVYHTP